MLLQYCDNLPDSFLPVPGPGFQILDFVGKVAEVEGEDEDNEEETKFEENAAEGESIFSGAVGWGGCSIWMISSNVSMPTSLSS